MSPPPASVMSSNVENTSSAVFDDTQFPFLLKEIYNTEMFKESEE